MSGNTADLTEHGRGRLGTLGRGGGGACPPRVLLCLIYAFIFLCNILPSPPTPPLSRPLPPSLLPTLALLPPGPEASGLKSTPLRMLLVLPREARRNWDFCRGNCRQMVL